MKNSSYYIQDSQNIMSDLLVRTFEEMPMVRIFDKGRSIYRQGDNAECFYYLKKGRVRIFLASENGTEKTLSVIGKGSILGEAAFFDGQNRMSSASAVVKSELVSVNKSILTDIIRREPRTAFEIFRLQAQTIRMLSSQIDGMTFQTAKSRIAQFLLRSAEDTISVTHEEIASIVGVSRVTVSKILSSLAEEGIVATGYQQIRLMDTDALQKIGGVPPLSE